MVCEMVVIEATSYNDPEKLRQLKVPQDAAVIGIQPGEKRDFKFGKQELLVECFGDNSASAANYLLEDSPLEPRSTRVLFDSSQWFPIPTYVENTWFLLRHRNEPGFRKYFEI